MVRVEPTPLNLGDKKVGHLYGPEKSVLQTRGREEKRFLRLDRGRTLIKSKSRVYRGRDVSRKGVVSRVFHNRFV